MIIGQLFQLNDEDYRVLYAKNELHLVINANPDADYKDIMLVKITNEDRKDVSPSIEIIEDRDLIKSFLFDMFKQAYQKL